MTKHRHLTPRQEMIFGYVVSEGPKTVAEAERALPVTSVRSTLDTLCRRGLLDAHYLGGGARAYRATDAGQALYDELFGDKPDEELSDEPLPSTVAARVGDRYDRFWPDSLIRAQRHLAWEDLTETEQVAVTAARTSPTWRATIGHVTGLIDVALREKPAEPNTDT